MIGPGRFIDKAANLNANESAGVCNGEGRYASGISRWGGASRGQGWECASKAASRVGLGSAMGLEVVWKLIGSL